MRRFRALLALAALACASAPAYQLLDTQQLRIVNRADDRARVYLYRDGVNLGRIATVGVLGRERVRIPLHTLYTELVVAFPTGRSYAIEIEPSLANLACLQLTIPPSRFALRLTPCWEPFDG